MRWWTLNDKRTVADPTTCKHENTVKCRKQQTNGKVAVKQCADCGQSLGCIPKKTVNYFELAPMFDEALEAAGRAIRQRHYQEIWEKARAAQHLQQYQKNADWNRRYQAHLLSDKWRRLRVKVFARSKGMCEGCAERRAVQVHHLTYDRMGFEMLFDLAAVCKRCHEEIHGRPIGEGRDEWTGSE